MSSEKQDASTEQAPATEAEPTKADATAHEEETSEADDTIECPNCGRTFSGTYCPDCGQEVGQSLTMTAIASDALGAASNIEGGFRSTMAALTLRPKQFFQKYLGGERKQFMSPGRYLTIAVLLSLGSMKGLTWLGIQQDFSDALAKAFGSGGSESKTFMDSVGQLVQSQWFSLAASLLSAGIFGLILWRLFDKKLNRGAEALTVGIFLISHAIVLSTAGHLLYVSSVYLWTGQPLNPMTYSHFGISIEILYAGLAAHYSFGTGWKSAFKSILGAFWARIEAIGIGSIVMVWYIFWSRPELREDIYANPQGFFTVMGGITVVYLLPFLLHAAVEAYYRLGSTSPQPENQ